MGIRMICVNDFSKAGYHRFTQNSFYKTEFKAETVMRFPRLIQENSYTAQNYNRLPTYFYAMPS